jgi:hypothetical protein
MYLAGRSQAPHDARGAHIGRQDSEGDKGNRTMQERRSGAVAEVKSLTTRLVHALQADAREALLGQSQQTHLIICLARTSRRKHVIVFYFLVSYMSRVKQYRSSHMLYSEQCLCKSSCD